MKFKTMIVFLSTISFFNLQSMLHPDIKKLYPKKVELDVTNPLDALDLLQIVFLYQLSFSNLLEHYKERLDSFVENNIKTGFYEKKTAQLYLDNLTQSFLTLMPHVVDMTEEEARKILGFTSNELITENDLVSHFSRKVVQLNKENFSIIPSVLNIYHKKLEEAFAVLLPYCQKPFDTKEIEDRIMKSRLHRPVKANSDDESDKPINRLATDVYSDDSSTEQSNDSLSNDSLDDFFNKIKSGSVNPPVIVDNDDI